MHYKLKDVCVFLCLDHRGVRVCFKPYRAVNMKFKSKYCDEHTIPDGNHIVLRDLLTARSGHIPPGREEEIRLSQDLADRFEVTATYDDSVDCPGSLEMDPPPEGGQHQPMYAPPGPEANGDDICWYDEQAGEWVCIDAD